MNDIIKKEEHRMKIVKDLLQKFSLRDDECHNFYYLNILIQFRDYFLEEDSVERSSEEVWLEYLDTLKVCFIIMGAIK